MAKKDQPTETDYKFNKETYWERKKRGLNGNIRPALYHAVVKDKDGNDQRIPLGDKMPEGQSASKYTGKHVDRHFTKPNHGKFVAGRNSFKKRELKREIESA